MWLVRCNANNGISTNAANIQEDSEESLHKKNLGIQFPDRHSDVSCFCQSCHLKCCLGTVLSCEF
jgi:hypothetical protein